MSSSFEPHREREVQRYLQSWKVAQGSALNVALNVDSIAIADLHGNGYTPHASADKALTAFAQLAVLRLNVRRCMISLIDGSRQIILTEATSHFGLGHAGATLPTAQAYTTAQDSEDPKVKNDLWLGASIVARRDVLCEHSLKGSYTARDPDGRTYTTSGHVVPDCKLDPRFENRPYVVANPALRFYAGVPIVSRNGHKIGVYAVAHDQPRAGLSIDELRFLQDTAQVVMEHLEWARDRVDRFKGERIVRGLATFIEGSTSTSHEDSAGGFPSKPGEGGEPRRHSECRPPELSLAGPRCPLTRANSDTYTSNIFEPTKRYVPQPISSSSSSSSRLGGSGGTKLGGSSSWHSLHSAQPFKGALQQLQQLQQKQQPKDNLSRMYQRAAMILRKSALADGVVLLGAAVSDVRQMNKIVEPGTIPSSDDEDMSWPGTSGSESVGGIDSSDSDASPSARPCKILAYNLADDRNRADIVTGSALSLGTLERYFAMYPSGKTFSFTQEGTGMSSEDDSASEWEPLKVTRSGGSSSTASPTTPTSTRSKTNRRRRKARVDHKELLRKIPGAKTIVFLPLYDYAEDRLAGGCFLWTSSTGRMMNLDEDLSYLRAFGNSIMSQVGRINTQKNEAAKTTFIASMSHELRSPLHGILGAIEFLKETETTSYQTDLVNAIFTCGKTLLDTLNHVLDYSKINRLGRAQMRRGGRQSKLINPSSETMESLSMTGIVDLALLVEEVVDSTAAGHTFQKLPGVSGGNGNGSIEEESPDQGPLHSPDPDIRSFQFGPISVLLDICPRSSWMVRTQPGALRRIIMNLFGNALKYTTSGYVLVSLRGQVNEDETRVDTVIKVIDTGKGMSEEFQRNRLFVPFSQEDTFQPGTGLGLSIVKQIVDSLGGSLEVRSQQNRGTEVDVRLTLQLGGPRDAAAAVAAHQADETMQSVVRQTRGLNLRVLREAPDYMNSDARTRKLNETLVDTCSDWFGLKVLRDSEPDEAEAAADFYLFTAPPSCGVLEKHLQSQKAGTKQAPIVIVCPNAEEARRISRMQAHALTTYSEVVEVIPQPCGPRKLARAFAACLRRSEEIAERERAAETRNARNGMLLARLLSEETCIPKLMDAAPIERDMPTITKAERPKPPERKMQGMPTRTSDLRGYDSEPKSPRTKDTDTGSPASSSASSSGSESDANSTAPPPLPPRRKTKPRHVLLVDDNKINLRLLVTFMKKCGFTYEQAENGQEAVDRFKEACLPTPPPSPRDDTPPPTPEEVTKCRFDFVLMDISMPVMNGLDATKHIRDYERENGLCMTNIIALTGLASADARRDAKSAGIDLFLPKPVKFSELKKLLTTDSE